jgi:putative FmdB family regulatory protein
LPTYSYICAACGAFDLVRPMAAAGEPVTCSNCGSAARRVFGTPSLRLVPAALRDALDAGHRSTDAPEVVTVLPPRTGRTQRRATDPRQARLPRP